MAAITVTGVGKTYGKQAVMADLHLAVEAGSFVVILGPSGCGKSTLLRMIAGLEEISRGEIRIADRVVNDLPPRERGCAMVFQNYALYPHMSVAANIGYSLKVAGVGRAERDARVRKVAETLGLVPYLDRRPAALSGGQRQRVAMGRAMIREPKIFLFDEPLSNLDAKLRVQMRLEIRRLHTRLGTTSIFVTHDQVEAMTLADTLVVMNAGRIEQVGTPAEIYRHPETRFVADFIGSPAMNILPATVRAGGAALPSGGRLGLPDGVSAVEGLAIEIGFRADEVEVLPPTAEGLPFVLELAEDLGSTRLLHGRLGDAPVALSIPAGDRVPATGDRFSVRVPTAALHAFDGVSGERLRAVPLAIAAE